MSTFLTGVTCLDGVTGLEAVYVCRDLLSVTNSSHIIKVYVTLFAKIAQMPTGKMKIKMEQSWNIAKPPASTNYQTSIVRTLLGYR